MDIKILINKNKLETRVGILENNTLVEIYVERSKESNLVGNIYKGTVLKILPGMQAAFVDIGLEKAGFLYVADAFHYYDDYKDYFEDSDEQPELEISKTDLAIQDLVKEGQELLVQIAKEPLGTKGARLTTHITLPGKYLVLLPTLEHIGVSKKILKEEERERLKNIIETIRGDTSYGFIARTASENIDEQDLINDKEFLVTTWKQILKKYEKSKAPSLLYQELDLVFRVIRDFYSIDINEILVDDKDLFNNLKNFLKLYLPRFKNKISYYSPEENEETLFEKYNIEMDFAKLFNRKIWLKSGGYIVIDKTEALTAIDVNTGKFTGKIELEDTILQTNIEAAKEIAYQLRLRNIGGLIVIDFIDMAKKENKEKLIQIFEDELKKDRSKVHLLKVSELGLVEMTRKRTQEDITTHMMDYCPTCEGNGYIKSSLSIICEIYRKILKNLGYYKNKELILKLHPYVAQKIMEEEKDILDSIETELNIPIEIQIFSGDTNCTIGNYEIIVK